MVRRKMVVRFTMLILAASQLVPSTENVVWAPSWLVQLVSSNLIRIVTGRPAAQENVIKFNCFKFKFSKVLKLLVVHIN